MRATVRKWGNSLALRIPSGLAADAELRDGAEVDLALDAGRLVVRPVSPEAVSLDALLKKVTPDNLHGEHPVDGARGAEAW